MGTRGKTSSLPSTEIQGVVTRKLLNHYQHAKIIQSFCSIHQIIREIHLILEPHDLKGISHIVEYPADNYKMSVEHS